MRSLNLLRLVRALINRRRSPAPALLQPLAPSVPPRQTEPTVYVDAPLSRVLIAIERRASDLELALAEYVCARRTAGMQPEAVLAEFKRLLRRAIGLDASPRLTSRLIELYFAA